MKLIQFTILFLFFSNVTFSQTYKIEPALGGVGEIGSKIRISTRKAKMNSNFLYFPTEKQIIKTDINGIIKEKIIFPFFSYATSNNSFKSIREFAIDKLNRILVFEDSDRVIYYFNADGSLATQTKNINEFLPETYEVAMANDSKNNLYVGGASGIGVFDNNGVFVKNIGKKGTANGEFNALVSQIFVDEQDNIYAFSNGVIQVFDKAGIFTSKFAIPAKDLIYFDGKETFYGSLSDYETIKAYDNKGNSINTITAGNDDERVYDVIGLIDKNPIVLVNKFCNCKYYAIYDLSTKKLNALTYSPSEKGGFDTFSDFQFDNQSNLWVMDYSKFQSFDKSDSTRYLEYEPDSFEYSDVNQILNINANNDVLFQTKLDNVNTLKTFNTKNINNTPKTIFTFKTDKDISYTKIDSVKKEIVVLASDFSGSSSVDVYGFDGNLKNNLIKVDEIMGMAQSPNGNYSLIIREGISYKYSINVYDNTGKLINKTITSIGQFGDSVIGVVFDDNNILHLAIRHVFNGKGYSIYAFDNTSKLLTSKLNLSDNQGNFTSNSSFLLKYYKGVLYLADYINDQIIRLTYGNGASTKFSTFITSTNLVKSINEPEFNIQATSNSNAPLIYSILSGDAVSVSVTGKVKILKAGKSLIKISQEETSQYLSAEKNIEITVNSKSSALISSTNLTKTFGDPDFTLLATSSSTAPLVFTLTAGDAVSLDAGGKIKILKAGTATIKISQIETAQFLAAEKNVEITVNKQNQEITFDKLPIEVFSNSKNLVLSAKSNLNLPVLFKVISGPASIINSNNLQLKGAAGQVIIEASQTGNTNINAAKSVTQTLKVLLVLGNENTIINTTIYPNPSQDFIELKNTENIVEYKIINMNGKIIYKSKFDKNQKIDINSLNTGVYTLQLLDMNNKKTNLRFIKN